MGEKRISQIRYGGGVNILWKFVVKSYFFYMTASRSPIDAGSYDLYQLDTQISLIITTLPFTRMNQNAD